MLDPMPLVKLRYHNSAETLAPDELMVVYKYLHKMRVKPPKGVSFNDLSHVHDCMAMTEKEIVDRMEKAAKQHQQKRHKNLRELLDEAADEFRRRAPPIWRANQKIKRHGENG